MKSNQQFSSEGVVDADPVRVVHAPPPVAPGGGVQPFLHDPVAVVTSEPFEARLAAWLVVWASRLLVVGLPVAAFIAGLVGVGGGDGTARLLLGLTMVAISLGVSGALLGRCPRLPFPLAWAALLFGHGLADGLPGELDPAGLVGHSLDAVGFHGALVLAGVVLTTFSLARDHRRVADVAAHAPYVLALVVAQAVVTLVRGEAVHPGGLTGFGALGSAAFLVVMVARLRADHRAVLDLRGSRGPGREVVLLGLVVAGCASVLFIPTPLVIAVAPYALLGGALGEASAARRSFRQRTGGRRTRKTLSRTDARVLATAAMVVGAVSTTLVATGA